jgi:hypothetical protein
MLLRILLLLPSSPLRTPGSQILLDISIDILVSMEVHFQELKARSTSASQFSVRPLRIATKLSSDAGFKKNRQGQFLFS